MLQLLLDAHEQKEDEVGNGQTLDPKNIMHLFKKSFADTFHRFLFWPVAKPFLWIKRPTGH